MTAKDDSYTPLNTEIEALERANSNYNAFFPKAGLLAVGDKGLEFNAEVGGAYIQIPWSMVRRVRVEFFFRDHYVRGFYVETRDDQEFEFVVSNCKSILKAMRKHLEREQFVRNRANIRNPFRRKQ